MQLKLVMVQAVNLWQNSLCCLCILAGWNQS